MYVCMYIIYSLIYISYHFISLRWFAILSDDDKILRLLHICYKYYLMIA